MTTTTFSSGTVIASSWLNDVNNVTYTVSGGGEPGSTGSAIELKTKRMYGKPSSTPNSGSPLAQSYYFDLNNNGTISSADALAASILPTTLAAITEDRINVAYGSSFGTKKAGVGFHTGTGYDILQASTGTTPPTYNSEVNAVIVGYMGTGARVVIQDKYLGELTATPSADQVISYVANQHRFVGGLGIGNTTSVTTSTYTVLQTDFDIKFATSASCTVTLPIATQENVGRILFIKNTAAFALTSASSNVVPLYSTSAGTSILPAGAGYWTVLKSDGTNWNVVASNVPKAQVYTDVTASRAVTTTYTNNTVVPMFVAIRELGGAGNTTHNLYVDGVLISNWYNMAGNSNAGTCSAVVPPGSTYSYTNSAGNLTTATWLELA